MTNKQLARPFKLAASLMELHGENPFKIRGYQSNLQSIENAQVRLSELSAKEIEALDGFTKKLSEKIGAILETGSFTELDALLEKTPAGVVTLLDLPGIGPKKIRTLWKDLGIETREALLTACEQEQVSALKGFGKKTEENIKEALIFLASQSGNFLYADIEATAETLEAELKHLLQSEHINLVGEFQRRLPVISKLEFLIGGNTAESSKAKLESIANFSEKTSGPFVLRGEKTLDEGQTVAIEIHFCSEKDFAKQALLMSSSEQHLRLTVKESIPLLKAVKGSNQHSEKEIYEGLGFHHIPSEAREGQIEQQFLIEKEAPKLLEVSDLKGILHNHSTYSDGSNTLEEMALATRDLGYDYLGISDHSKSAFYANGLDEGQIIKQHQEIDALNEKLAPFKIFKGIESDILNDGSLDYSEDVLKSFDFIVSSIHSNLNMDIEKATQRLITAIENPYTTFLGHPTGRLLLKRQGYPIDHRKVIDACAENGVIIEINAHPVRLDLDWQWVSYALEKGVKLSINPDAHAVEQLELMKYGVLIGRKGGLTKEMTFNALSRKEVEAHFQSRK